MNFNFLSKGIFCLIFSLANSFAGSATVDLNVSLSISQNTIEAGQPYEHLIVIANENALSDAAVDAAGTEIQYEMPSGSSYNSFSGSGWQYISTSGSIVTFAYNTSLTNQQTSNQLSLSILAPNSVETLSPSVSVYLSGAIDPNSANDIATDTLYTGKSNLTASKTVSKTTLSVDEEFVYTIEVNNSAAATTTVPTRDIVITDTIPASLTFQSFGTNELGCTNSGNVITCAVADLAVDSTKTVVLNVKASPGGGTDIINSASISAASTDYNTIPFNVEAPAINIEQADVTIAKTLIGGLNATDATDAAVDSDVTYRLVVSNSGATNALDVNITDVLPAGVTFVSATSGCGESSGTVTCTVGTVVNGTPQTFDILVTMPSTHGDITNNASVVTSSPESDTTNNSAALITSVKGADLKITKTQTVSSVDIGSSHTYTIIVENLGQATAENVTVIDTLDSDPFMAYVSSTDFTPAIAGQTLTYNLGDIASGTNKTFTVTVNMPTDKTGIIQNKVDVNTTTGEANSDDLSFTIDTTLAGPDLNIVKDANVTDVGLGKPFTYTIEVQNVNTAAAVDANITDQLPNGFRITGISSNPDGWSCPDIPQTSGTFNCTLASFAGGHTSTLVFDALAPNTAGNNQINTATISHSLDSNDGQDTASVNVVGVTLSIDKTASATAIVGGLIDYNITVENNSLTDAEALTITDDLSSLGTGYTINTITALDGWSCSGTTTLSCTRPLLASGGASSTIQFSVNVPNSASLGTVTNTASVTTTTEPAPTVSNSADTTILGADLYIVPPTTLTAIANKNVIFSVEVRNDGSATAKDVNLTNLFNTNSAADFTNILIDCSGGTNFTTGSPYVCNLGDIANGSPRTITISATAPNYDSTYSGSNITNNSTVTTSTAQSDANNTNVDWDVTINGADLLINKSANVTEIAVGGVVTYDINLTNQWAATATNINITDTVLQIGSGNFILDTLTPGINWTCSTITDAGTTFSCSYDLNLTQGQSTSNISIQAIAPTALDAIDNNRDNQVTVATDTAEREIATSNTNIASVTIRGADLNISKTVSPNPAQLNEVVTYTITVTNSDLATALDTNATDILPAGHTNISTLGCNNDGSSVSGNSVNCSLGDIAQGASKSFTITANAPILNGDYINTVTVASSTLEANMDNNQDSIALQVRGADLTIHKIAPSRVAGNSFFTYTLNVQNIGLSPAYGATLSDTLPADVNYVGPLTSIDTAWNCSESNSVISCQTTDSNLSIPPGYNKNIVSFQVQANAAHYYITNSATVATNTSDSNLANDTNTSVTEVIDVDLVALKFAPNYIDINGTVTYTLQVRNASLTDIDITDINYTDILPSNVADIVITPDARFTCNHSGSVAAGTTLQCSMNDGLANPLEQGQTATVATVTLRASQFDINNEANNIILNQYRAQTSLSDQNLGNNAPGGSGFLEIETLVRGANMSIVKTVSSDPVGANQNFTYNLEIKNWPREDNNPNNEDIPDTTAQNIVAQDTLPPNVVFVSAVGTNWSCSETSQVITCNYTGGMDAQNSSSNIVITVTAPNLHGEVLNNEANVTTSTPELVRLLPDNTDSATTTTQGTNITVTKIGPETAGMGDTISYSITVENTSTTHAQDIFVIDTLPSGATYNANLTGTGWSNTVNTSPLRFEYDDNLSANSSTSFSFDVILPNYTGVVRNHAEANTSTVEISTPNIDEWDIDIIGSILEFDSTPSQNNPVGAYGLHEYNITIKNSGHSDANDINVTITYNDPTATTGWSDVNGSGTDWNCGAYNTTDNTMLCRLSSLASGNTVSPVLTISSIAPNYNGDIVNSVTLIGSDGNTTTGETISLTTTIVGSNLSITKSANDPNHPTDSLVYHDNDISVGASQPINFKISATNDNRGLAKDIYVIDTFDSDFTDLNVTSFGDWDSCIFSGQTLTCQRAELAYNATAGDIIISAKSPNSIGDYDNQADINTSTIETDSGNNDDEVDIEVEGATLNATFDVSKTVVALGEVFTYELNITNSGRNPAVDVIVTDDLDADLTYLDFNGSDVGWSYSSNAWTQEEIVSYSGSTMLKLNVQAHNSTIGTYSNNVDINSTSIASPISNISAPDVRVVGADLVVDINATPSEVLEDRNVTYVINVKDINISTAYDINVTQSFSHTINALYIDSNGSGTCDIADDNQSVSCLFTSIEYNQDKNITITATMPFTNTIIDLTSTVSVTTVTTEEDSNNNSANVDVKVMPIMPVVNYRFDECKWTGVSGEVKDSSANALHGKSRNDADTISYRLAEDNTNFSPIWRVGVFDGSNDRVTITNNNKLQITGNQTMCAWVKPTSFSKRRNIIAKAYGGEGTITQETSGRLSYYYGTYGGNSVPYQHFNTDTSLALNQWSHICVVRDLDNMKLRWYINSEMDKENDADYSQATASTRDLLIGEGYAGDFAGNIDEVEIYNIALDDRAINDIYNFERDHKNYDGSERVQNLCGVDLEVIKTSSPNYEVGAESDLIYTIKVKNLSAEPVTEGFTLSDNLPLEVEYVSEVRSTNWSGSTGDQNITWTFLPGVILDYNDEETIILHVKTKNLDKVNITNTAISTTTQPDTDSTNNSGSANNRIIGTDLSISKTATPDLPTPGTNFIYTLRVENLSTIANARDIVISDKLDTRLVYHSISNYTNENNITINCAVPDSNSTIYCDIPKLSKGNFVEFNITVQSPDQQTGLLNEAYVASITKDTDLSNNSATLTTDTNATASSVHINILNEKYFNKDASVNRYGNMAAIGNTMLIAENLAAGVKLNEINSTKLSSSSAELDIIDTANSNEDNITIEYAGLFWGGHVRGSDENETGYDVNFGQISFTTPDGTIHTIIADKNDTDINSTEANRVGFYHFKKGDEDNITSNKGDFRIFYGAKANITDIIKNLDPASTLEGTYSVSDMQVTSGIDSFNWAPTEGADWERFRNYGYFGGWSMVVIYSVSHRHHRGVKFKNLSSFSGFRTMLPKSPGSTISLDINIEGFITPLHGDIESTLFSFIQGGDRELPLESMSVENKDGNEHDAIEDLNNTDNIFNSTITLKDFDGSNISKTPDLNYNVGTDIDQFNLSSNYDEDENCDNSDGRPCYLSNSQDTTKVKISVSQADALDAGEYPSEKAFAQMISMQTQIFTPDFIDSYKECFKLKDPLAGESHGWVHCSEDLPLLRRGDIMKYRITVINTGDDYAKDVYIIDNLPEEVTYEDNSSVVTYVTPFMDINSSSPCSSDQYDYNETTRTACMEDLNSHVDGNLTTPYVLPASDINDNYNGTSYDGNSTLVFNFDHFQRNHVAWIEFNTTVNRFAGLGDTIENQISITFTNPTLESYGYTDSTVTQVSLPVVTSPITFNWDNILIMVRDVERDSVGAKVVNEPFDLNITLSGISSFDIDENTTIRLNTLRIIDEFNALTKNIWGDINDANTTLGDENAINWFTDSTFYNKASRELGFDMNISIHDGNYTASRVYPQDFNASAPYAGDAFSTRPASFSITLAGATISGVYSIVNAGEPNLIMNITAPDFNNIASSEYNASLSNGAGIEIGLDSNFSTNPSCLSAGDFNLTDANFVDGIAASSDIKYNEVGIIQIILKDSNWTAIDSTATPVDCNATSISDNNSSDADGLISCSVDGNSSSVVFKPNHFSFTNTDISNHNNFTYMVENPIDDPMFSTITTTVESRNADNNITTFFSDTCFADDVNLSLLFNVVSKDLGALAISVANENNLTSIEVDTTIAATNIISTTAYGSDFPNGTSNITLRIAIDRNDTVPQQPLLIDAQDLNGSIDNFLGVANADVSDANGTDISAEDDLYFYYGRVHAPDYRFAGLTGDAKIFYEVYCDDCNSSYRDDFNITGSESVDSINWYINTLHTQIIDGNVSEYSSADGATFDTTVSTSVVSGIETIQITAPKVPHKDKVEMNSTSWTTSPPTSFLVEFQDELKDWAGQGELGQIVDTNVSKRSQRRMEW